MYVTKLIGQMFVTEQIGQIKLEHIFRGANFGGIFQICNILCPGLGICMTSKQTLRFSDNMCRNAVKMRSPHRYQSISLKCKMIDHQLAMITWHSPIDPPSHTEGK